MSNSSLIQCTLLFLVRDGEILLAMKKRGFGAGHWNGVGGKVDQGESIESAMLRECQEEILVTPLNYQQVAIHTFLYSNSPDIEAHAFLCDRWQGTPAETEEMRPQWFSTTAIPYDDMWVDDQFWLPQVLDGKKVKATFSFDDNHQITDQTVQTVEKLD